MSYSLKWTGPALNDLVTCDRNTSDRIVSKVEFWCKQLNPLRFAKKLTNAKVGDYRFRVGDYRILFELDTDGLITILVILRVRHRRKAYD